MSYCKGCGGVLGRDCYHEQDCIQISLQQEHDLHLENFLQRDLYDAEQRILFLEEFIVSQGLDIPHLGVELDDEEDWLPF